MRILAIADRPPSRPIRQILAETPVDLIVTLGDLELSQIRDLELVTDIPKLGVYKNHCSGSYMPDLGIVNMHLNVVTIVGKTFGGFQGCVRYKNGTAPMFTQEEASALLENFPRVDVMLVHCPPFGINNDQTEIAHTGFVALRDYLDFEHPMALFHGHTYPTETTMVRQYKSTRIIYVTGDQIVGRSQ